jgi:hypothetical protein
MLIPHRSNPNERHKRFRKRHPGYHARIQGRKRQGARQSAAILTAQIQAKLAAAASDQPSDLADQLLLPFAM